MKSKRVYERYGYSCRKLEDAIKNDDCVEYWQGYRDASKVILDDEETTQKAYTVDKRGRKKVLCSNCGAHIFEEDCYCRICGLRIIPSKAEMRDGGRYDY